MLHKINPTVMRAVADAGLPMKAIRSRTRPWNEESDPGDYDTLLEFNLEETVRQEGGRTEEELIIDGEPMFTSIMRGALQVRPLCGLNTTNCFMCILLVSLPRFIQ